MSEKVFCPVCEGVGLIDEKRRNSIEETREFMERVNAISINPEMATIQDIVNMAEALQDFFQ